MIYTDYRSVIRNNTKFNSNNEILVKWKYIAEYISRFFSEAFPRSLYYFFVSLCLGKCGERAFCVKRRIVCVLRDGEAQRNRLKVKG